MLSSFAGTQWYAFNVPKHDVVRRKLQWIGAHGYGGVGVTTLDGDDPKNKCGGGSHPLSSFVSATRRCSRRASPPPAAVVPINSATTADSTPTLINTGPTRCTRLCIYRPAVHSIELTQLDPSWCSHLVLSSYSFKVCFCSSSKALKLGGLQNDGSLLASTQVRDAIAAYARWPVAHKPRLLLSIGGDTSNERWNALLADSKARHTFAQAARQVG